MAIEKKRVINIETGNSQRNVQTLKQQIKELRDSMGMMEKGTEEWDKASVKLSSALQKQREIAEAGAFTNQDYGNKLANISKVGAGVTAGINGLTNALSLMGVQIGKDDTAMIKFTTSMMAVVQGLASLDTASKAWKGLLVGMNAALDARLKDTASTVANTVSVKANTAAKTENTAATAANATATGGATVATNGLSAAVTKLSAALRLSKAALGAIGIALAAVGAAVALVVNHFKKMREEEQRLNDKMADTAARMAEMNNAAASAITSYVRLRASFVQAREDGADLTEWMKENRSELDKMGAATDNVNDLENIFIKNTDAFVKALTARYKAEWELNALGKEYEETLMRRNMFEASLANGPNKDGNYTFKDKEGKTVTAKKEDILSNLRVIGNQLDRLGVGIERGVFKLTEANSSMNQFFTKSISNQDKQVNTLAERENIERIINESKIISAEIRKVMEQFIAGKSGDELDNFLYNLNVLSNGDPKVNRLLSDTMKKLLDSFKSGSDSYRGTYGYKLAVLNKILKDFNQTIDKTDGNVGGLMADIGTLMTMIGKEAEQIISGDWILGRNGIFDSKQYEKDIKELYSVENKIEEINARDRNEKLAREQKINGLIAERVRLEKELSKEKQWHLDHFDYEQDALKKIMQINQAIDEIKNEYYAQKYVIGAESPRETFTDFFDKVTYFWTHLFDKSISEQILKDNKTIDAKYKAAIAELEKKRDTYKKLVDDLSVDNTGYLTEEINKLNKQIEELQNLPEVKSVELPGLTARKNELEENLKYYKEIIRLQEEAESKGLEDIMMSRDTLGSMQVYAMEMLGADQKEIYAAQIDFKKGTVDLLEKYRENQSRTDEERVNTELKIMELNKEINELAKARQELVYKEGAERLANLQAELRQRYDSTIGDMDVYNKGWARLGSSDWNDPTARLDAERMMLQARFDLAEQYRQQNLINEKDYLDQLKQYQADMHSWQIDMMTAAAQRRLDILNTSFDAVRSIVSSVNGLLSETIAGEEQNSTRYKQLRIAQTIASGSVASIEALRSGIQSPIPAPGNYALGLGLMGSTIAQTVMAVGNIRNETLNGNSSAGLTNGALNIGGNVYETLAYETNSEISSNIRDSRVYVVESDINQTGNRVYVAESEATW